ncbi:hypothetical protein SS50377_23581 [Spironucleus salmonicida]|uniref:Ankyrin repeat-containing protein n=1 Tax=Spironucleus salmonicida TaxID=348837 RepID=V6M5C8_9EUKA|nr:hypothetical protein SS50377_23581 [Spironucleus salmonicida]|eukprot:EST48564.1 hypothetical protein SS50377_11175 [Spironucleus salmonicida]
MKRLKQKRWFDSAKRDKFLIIKKQLSRYVSTISEEGLTALLYCCINNSYESAEFLLESEIYIPSSKEITINVTNLPEKSFTFPVGSHAILFSSVCGSKKVTKQIIQYCTMKGLIGLLLGQFPTESRIYNFAYNLGDDLKILTSDAYIDSEILGNVRSDSNAAILAAKTGRKDVLQKLLEKSQIDLFEKHVHEMILYQDSDQMMALDYIHPDSEVYNLVEKMTLDAQHFLTQKLTRVNASGLDFVADKCEILTKDDFNHIKKLVSHSRKGSAIYMSEYTVSDNFSTHVEQE